MKRKLEIKIIFENWTEININKIKVELIKLWLKVEVLKIDNITCLIEIQTFEISFSLDIVDVISYVLMKAKLLSAKEIKYKLEYYADYMHILHYFLLDFNLAKEEKEHVSWLFSKIIETPIYLDKELLQKWKIRLKNKNIINLDNLRKIFLLDKKILYINNSALKEKLMRFILDTRSKVWSYIFI